MIEVNGNLWTADADVILITTNGIVKNDGRAVMGAGVAKDALEMFPGIDYILGGLLERYGNTVFPLTLDKERRLIATFPTKNDWRHNSDIKLIEQSAYKLVEIMNRFPDKIVAMPRPGCGNGKLDWASQVKPLLENILIEDRYEVYSL